jgi:hypothetical protein
MQEDEIKLRTVYCSKQDYNSAHVFLDVHYIFIVIYSHVYYLQAQ